MLLAAKTKSHVSLSHTPLSLGPKRKWSSLQTLFPSISLAPILPIISALLQLMEKSHLQDLELSHLLAPFGL